jgi:alkylated DNA nucleotide flippase Atl1
MNNSDSHRHDHIVEKAIPCHRVIKNNGEQGNYRWGVSRKTAMLAWERALLD